MLTITVGEEFFDDETQTFLTRNAVVLELEHSLVALSKWESIFEKPFLSSDKKTDEEMLAYVEAMTLTKNYPADIFTRLNEKNIDEISKYIDAKRSATWFNELPAPKSKEIITSELIYYWLVALEIPFEVENWHLNRLFTLIKVCGIKSSKPKKMSRSEMAARNRELNAQRKQQLGTSG